MAFFYCQKLYWDINFKKCGSELFEESVAKTKIYVDRDRIGIISVRIVYYFRVCT
jgi:hypothetical protein